MSLATTAGIGGSMGGGLGASGGGLVMSHQPNAMMSKAPPPPQQGASSIPGSDGGGGGGGGGGIPMSIAAAEVVDKSQNLTVKQVRSVSHLPLVGVDMFGPDVIVASFPPKPKEIDLGLMPALVGKLKSQVSFKKGETSHRTLRKYLTQRESYESLTVYTLGTAAAAVKHGVAEIKDPHHWMGARRLRDVPQYVKDLHGASTQTPLHEESSPSPTSVTAAAIAEDSMEGTGIQITNGTLDGISNPAGDDFDRVVFKVRLAETKKSLTMFPEEVTKMVLTVAQKATARHFPKTQTNDENQRDNHDNNNNNNNTTASDKLDKAENHEEFMEYPCAIALPPWACHDRSLEAWLDAAPPGGVFVQRSVAALVGAMRLSEPNKLSDIVARAEHVSKEKRKAHQRLNDDTPFTYRPLLVMVGLSKDGVEATAMEVSDVQPKIPSCLYGTCKVLANVAYPTADPMSKLEDCVKELFLTLDEVAPELDEPVGMVTFGTVPKEQESMKKALEALRQDLETWEKVPVFVTKLDTVAIGTAILGGVSHGRIVAANNNKQEGGGGKESMAKPKPQLALRIQDVAPCAVGIQMSYTEGTWEPVKTLFDFGRRVPAGPLSLDLNAAECAALRKAAAEGKQLSEEQLLAAIKRHEGKKGIPDREEAALDFRVQLLQKHSRDGEWVKVGNSTFALTKPDPVDDEKRLAIERVTLNLSLGPTGIITQELYGDFETVRQATLTEQRSRFWYWFWICLAVVFFGGFFVRSYWEDYSFQRDTARLIAYYKHVVPGSLADGDKQNARYLVWKYRYNREQLWRRLETKYGHPVLHAHEWPDDEDDDEGGGKPKDNDESDESQDLDDEEEEQKVEDKEEEEVKMEEQQQEVKEQEEVKKQEEVKEQEEKVREEADGMEDAAEPTCENEESCRSDEQRTEPDQKKKTDVKEEETEEEDAGPAEENSNDESEEEDEKTADAASAEVDDGPSDNEPPESEEAVDEKKEADATQSDDSPSPDDDSATDPEKNEPTEAEETAKEDAAAAEEDSENHPAATATAATTTEAAAGGHHDGDDNTAAIEDNDGPSDDQ